MEVRAKTGDQSGSIRESSLVSCIATAPCFHHSGMDIAHIPWNIQSVIRSNTSIVEFSPPLDTALETDITVLLERLGRTCCAIRRIAFALKTTYLAYPFFH